MSVLLLLCSCQGWLPFTPPSRLHVACALSVEPDGLRTGHHSSLSGHVPPGARGEVRADGVAVPLGGGERPLCRRNCRVGLGEHGLLERPRAGHSSMKNLHSGDMFETYLPVANIDDDHISNKGEIFAIRAEAAERINVLLHVV